MSRHWADLGDRGRVARTLRCRYPESVVNEESAKDHEVKPPLPSVGAISSGPLVPPHESEISPRVPTKNETFWHPDLDLSELASLMRVVEDGRSEQAQEDARAITIRWKNGGETAVTAAQLPEIAQVDQVAEVSSYTRYGDNSTLFVDVLFRGSRKPVYVSLRWYMPGIGRQRAETIKGKLADLRNSRRLAVFLTKRGVAASLSYLSALAAIIVVVRLLPEIDLPTPWPTVVPSILGAVVALPFLVWIPRWVLNGRLIRARPVRDWAAIGQMLSAVAAIVAIVLSFK